MSSEFYMCACPRCGWTGMSNETAGGGQIADTGDYSDMVCPVCVKTPSWDEGMWVPVVDLEGSLEDVTKRINRALKGYIGQPNTDGVRATLTKILHALMPKAPQPEVQLDKVEDGGVTFTVKCDERFYRLMNYRPSPEQEALEWAQRLKEAEAMDDRRYGRNMGTAND